MDGQGDQMHLSTLGSPISTCLSGDLHEGISVLQVYVAINHSATLPLPILIQEQGNEGHLTNNVVLREVHSTRKP